jgi:NADH:ubiquinone oxidoreductase subunit 5 (subunit L)/multisubunit Na+/H+ antiporter MnhA subunit
LNRKWFFDKIYGEIFAQNFLIFSYNSTYKVIDRGVIEIFGPKSLSFLIQTNASFFSGGQTGYVYHYAFSIVIGLFFFLFAICNNIFCFDFCVFFSFFLFFLKNVKV